MLRTDLFVFRDVLTACQEKGKPVPFLELGPQSDVLKTELQLAAALTQYRGDSYVMAARTAGRIAGDFGKALSFGGERVYPYRQFMTQALIERLCPDDLPPPPPVVPDWRPEMNMSEAPAPAMRQISDWVVQHARALQAGSLVLAGGAAVAGLILRRMSIPAMLVGAGVTALGLAS